MKPIWHPAKMGCAALLLAGCNPSVPPEAVSSEPETGWMAPRTVVKAIDGPEMTRAVIDWQAARADYADRPASAETNQFAIASGGGTPVVPVLLPPASFSTASADGTPGLRVVPMADGYYAVARGEKYDTIINGSDRLIAGPEGLETIEPGSLRFSETMTGADVAFRRYGASYLVEFHCKGRPPLGGDPCINQTEALAAVESLLLAETQ